MISRNRYAGRAGVKGISLTLVAVLVLGVLGASSAFGSNSFTMAQRIWGTGTFPGVRLAGARPVTVSSNALLFQSTLSGAAVEWTASGVECPDCKIENRTGAGGKSEAIFSGQISLTGVKSIKPANCTMPSTLVLKPITGLLGGSSSPGYITDELYPTEGTTLASYELGGSSCGFSGLYNLTGATFGQFVNALGVASKIQEFRLTQANQEALGSASSMKLAGNPAFFTTTIRLAEEEEFQVRESFPVNEGNAFIAPSTNPLIPRNWYTGAQPGTKLVGVQAVETSLASEKLTFNGTAYGLPVRFTASGLECSGCKIENRVGTGANKGNTEAVFSGTLSYTGLSMSSPSGCSISVLKSKPLTGVIGGEKGSSTKAAFRLAPTEGTGLANLEVTGANCPIGGSVLKLNGSEFGEFVNPLGVDSKTQRFRLNETIQEILGSPTSLKFGEDPVRLNGEVNLTSAAEVQVKEK